MNPTHEILDRNLHTSPETALVVDDYPYGFRLRCKIRYWLETDAKRGTRFVSQTTNPKKAGEIWNKPKPSTYSKGVAIMTRELSTGHIGWTTFELWMFSYADKVQAFVDAFGEDHLRAMAPEFFHYQTMHRQCVEARAKLAEKKGA